MGFLYNWWESFIINSNNAPLLFVAFPFLLHQMLFWSYSLLLMLVDLNRFPSLYSYKIQKKVKKNKEIKILSSHSFFIKFLDKSEPINS